MSEIDVKPKLGIDAGNQLAAERTSEHPLAAAVVDGARRRGYALGDVVAFEALAGRGVTARGVDAGAAAAGRSASSLWPTP